MSESDRGKSQDILFGAAFLVCGRRLVRFVSVGQASKKRKQASCKMPQDANNYPDVIHDLLTLTAPLHFGSRPGTEKLLSRDESLTRLAGEAKMLWQPVCLRVLFGDDRCESHPVRQQGPGTMLDRKVSHFSQFRFRFH